MSYNPTSMNNPNQPVRRIGPYELREELGKGGMAQVFKAYQPSLDRYVAIKILSPNLASDPSFIERFRHEARAIARLRHPNIVAVHDFGEENGTYYLVMELIDGRTLRDEMKKGLIPPNRLLEIIEQVGSALDTAHRNNILHRDIKPNNILLEGPRRAVLSDFGIAKELDRNTVLTQAGYGVGTPDYMSPEQALGQNLDPRSDQYSLGIVVYEMMTGRTPFRSDSAVAVLAAHISTPPPPPRQFNPRISPAIEGILMRALSKEPKQRFHSVMDMVRALGQEINPSNADMARTFVGGVNPPRPAASVPSAPPSPPPTVAIQGQQATLAVSGKRQADIATQAASIPPPAVNAPPPPPYATATPRTLGTEGFFGYKGMPGSIPVPKGPIGELPPPLKKRGMGCLIILLVLLVLLIIGLVVALVLWKPWEKVGAGQDIAQYLSALLGVYLL